MNPRRYLLGDLSPAERAEVDERLFHDDELFDQLLSAEEELMADYLEQRLPPRERRRFEEHVLASAPRRRNLELTRALRRHGRAGAETIGPAPARRRLAARRWALAGGLAAVAAAAAGLLLVGPRWQPDGLVTASLTPGLLRGQSGVAELVVPPGTGTVQLQLALADTAPADRGYLALLRTAEGNPIWKSGALHRQRSTIVLRLPVRVLRTADYILTLQSTSAAGPAEDVADYVFRVTVPAGSSWPPSR